MAEVKNNFIKSKMNKDLDRRLIPSGEYINAINAQISMSEGDGVGTLENILGNELIANIEPTIPNLFSIGYYVDQINNFIYIFLTDNDTASYVPPVPLNTPKSNHFIYRYNATNGTTTKLVEGAFLNFSTLNPIYGVNLLENLLFFTDNRNQPRKINVTNAANSVTYYQTEEQISVAKYNPYDSIYLYELSTQSASPTPEYQSTMKDVVSKFLPTGGSAVVQASATGTTFSIGDGIFPFYPNLPMQGQTVGKITTPGGPITLLPVTVGVGSSASSVVLSGSIPLVAGNELIFLPNPYYNNTYAGDSTFLEDKFARFSYRFKFDDNEYSLIAPFTQPCFIPKQDGYFLTTGTGDRDDDQNQAAESSIVSFMENKVNSIGLQIPLPAAQNALLNDFKITEIEILYKESDGLVIKAVDTIDVASLSSSSNVLEYLYIGKKPFKTLLEKETARVFDKVPVRSLAQEVSGNRIIYSNFQNRHTPPASLDYNINVSEKSEFSLRTGSGLSAAPLPSGSKTINLSGAKGVIEIGSKVSFTGAPANLLVQSVVGSPVPTAVNVDQNVTIGSVGTAITFTPSSNDQNTTTRQEYPSSSLKTNRSYQVGVVLSDKFGRTSDVILTNNDSIITIGTQSFSGSSLYSPYLTADDPKADVWAGNSLKVLFNSVIGPENPSGFYPGLYNGDINSVNYNPLGWYSYKIVVQQKEQDYYNVYAPGAIKGDIDAFSTGALTPNQNTSRIILINDNINKVPRDLSEVGPQDKKFRSSVQLIGRVVNNSNQWVPTPTAPSTNATSTDSNLGNQQYYPDTRTFTTNSIQPLFDDVDWPNSFYSSATATAPPPLNADEALYSFYNSEANPFLATITTSQLKDDNYQFGTTNISVIGLSVQYVPINQLCVLETKPVTSLLDIYYETSTSGLINDLNTAILNDIGISGSLNNFNYNLFTEALAPTDIINNPVFNIVDQFNVPLLQGGSSGQYSSFTLVSAFNTEETPQDVTNYFTLVQVATGTPGLFNYNVSVTQDFVDNVYYGSDAGTRNFNLTFNVQLVDVAEPIVYQEQIFLGNVAPEMYEDRNVPPLPISPVPGTTAVTPLATDFEIYRVYGRNGAFIGNATYGSNPNTELDLSWDIISVTNAVTNQPLQEPYPFGLNVTIPTSGPGAGLVSDCSVRNIKEPPESIKAAQYEINLQLSDAGQSIKTLILTATYGTPASAVYERNYTFGGFPPERFVEVKFEFSGSQNGWYVFTGSWQDLLGTINFGGNTIVISNAVEPADPCPPDYLSQPRWFYGGVAGGNFDVSLDNIKNKLAACYPSGGTIGPPSTSGVLIPGSNDGIGYAFEIIS